MYIDVVGYLHLSDETSWLVFDSPVGNRSRLGNSNNSPPHKQTEGVSTWLGVSVSRRSLSRPLPRAALRHSFYPGDCPSYLSPPRCRLKTYAVQCASACAVSVDAPGRRRAENSTVSRLLPAACEAVTYAAVSRRLRSMVFGRCHSSEALNGGTGRGGAG